MYESNDNRNNGEMGVGNTASIPLHFHRGEHTDHSVDVYFRAITESVGQCIFEKALKLLGSLKGEQ